MIRDEKGNKTRENFKLLQAKWRKTYAVQTGASKAGARELEWEDVDDELDEGWSIFRTWYAIFRSWWSNLDCDDLFLEHDALFLDRNVSIFRSWCLCFFIMMIFFLDRDALFLDHDCLFLHRDDVWWRHQRLIVDGLSKLEVLERASEDSDFVHCFGLFTYFYKRVLEPIEHEVKIFISNL